MNQRDEEKIVLTRRILEHLARLIDLTHMIDEYQQVPDVEKSGLLGVAAKAGYEAWLVDREGIIAYFKALDMAVTIASKGEVKRIRFANAGTNVDPSECIFFAVTPPPPR